MIATSNLQFLMTLSFIKCTIDTGVDLAYYQSLATEPFYFLWHVLKYAIAK